MSARRLMVLLLAALALVAAGCGGGGSDEASGDTDTVVTDTMTTEDMTTTEDMETTEDTETTEGSVTGTTDDDFDASELGGKCKEFVGVGAELSAALSGQNTDVGNVEERLDQLADKVPDEIKGDYQVLVDYLKKVAEAMKGVDTSSGQTPNAAALAKLQQLAASVDTQKLQQASQHLEAWAKENC